MKPASYFAKLASAQQRAQSLLCLGLDPEPSKLPRPFRKRDAADVWHFCREIIDLTSDLVCAYKPNWAFYEALGIEGLRALSKILDRIPRNIPIIADAKRGDIGNTASCYARSLFEFWGVDAATVNPFLGIDTLEPFLAYKEKGVYALCLTSNPGSADFQTGGRLYIKIARKLAEHDFSKNLGLVVGATQAARIRQVRRIAPSLPFLLPGVGSQGGDAQLAVRYAWAEREGSVVVNASRSILYAATGKDFAKAARHAAESMRLQLHNAIPSDAKSFARRAEV